MTVYLVYAINKVGFMWVEEGDISPYKAAAIRGVFSTYEKAKEALDTWDISDDFLTHINKYDFPTNGKRFRVYFDNENNYIIDLEIDRCMGHFRLDKIYDDNDDATIFWIFPEEEEEE